ncbi:MAG: hypothetical protein RLN86_06465 [Cyclobacteriaceae bacterium]
MQKEDKSTTQLKSSLHQIVDRLENEHLLSTIYSFLKQREESKGGQLWNSLSKDQKAQVLNAFDESEDDNNLVDDSDVWKSI